MPSDVYGFMEVEAKRSVDGLVDSREHQGRCMFAWLGSLERPRPGGYQLNSPRPRSPRLSIQRFMLYHISPFARVGPDVFELDHMCIVWSLLTGRTTPRKCLSAESEVTR